MNPCEFLYNSWLAPSDPSRRAPVDPDPMRSTVRGEQVCGRIWKPRIGPHRAEEEVLDGRLALAQARAVANKTEGPPGARRVPYRYQRYSHPALRAGRKTMGGRQFVGFGESKKE